MTQSSTERMSISKAHQRVVDLDWTPTYAERAKKYSTDYHFPKSSSKDAMKQILHSYFPMQEEKDSRVYAALDAAVRGNMFQTAHPRYTEWMKLFVGVFPFIEACAARAMTALADVQPSPEVRNGLMFQMIDEVRHTGIQQNLGRWYAQNYIDPAGFDASQRVVNRTVAGTFARQFAEGFITGDPVTSSCIYLQVVAETAFTNVLFVANPSIAARNGDYVLPSVFMSVQSDEARHINNGYSTLLMVLQDPDNHPLIERDLRYAFWQLHCIVDGAMGLILDYGSKNRPGQESYLEMWKRWVYDDYYRTYLIPMEKYGLRVPHDMVNAAWERLSEKGYHHKLAMNLAALWPFNFWRFDPMDERDFEWFESKYPGWYNEYGKFWERYRETQQPNNPLFCCGNFGYNLPYTCWSCLAPIVIREDLVVGEVNGQVYTYCSDYCHWTHKVFSKGGNGARTPHTGLFTGQRDWLGVYHGQSAAAALQDAGLVRRDGKTLTAQPHLIFDDRAMWTLDHGFRDVELVSPLRLLREMSPADREKAAAAYRAGITIS